MVQSNLNKNLADEGGMAGANNKSKNIELHPVFSMFIKNNLRTKLHQKKIIKIHKKTSERLNSLKYRKQRPTEIY